MLKQFCLVDMLNSNKCIAFGFFMLYVQSFRKLSQPNERPHRVHMLDWAFWSNLMCILLYFLHFHNKMQALRQLWWEIHLKKWILSYIHDSRLENVPRTLRIIISILLFCESIDCPYKIHIIAPSIIIKDPVHGALCTLHHVAELIEI